MRRWGNKTDDYTLLSVDLFQAHEVRVVYEFYYSRDINRVFFGKVSRCFEAARCFASFPRQKIYEHGWPPETSRVIIQHPSSHMKLLKQGSSTIAYSGRIHVSSTCNFRKPRCKMQLYRSAFLDGELVGTSYCSWRRLQNIKRNWIFYASNE